MCSWMVSQNAPWTDLKKNKQHWWINNQLYLTSHPRLPARVSTRVFGHWEETEAWQTGRRFDFPECRTRVGLTRTYTCTPEAFAAAQRLPSQSGPSGATPHWARIRVMPTTTIKAEKKMTHLLSFKTFLAINCYTLCFLAAQLRHRGGEEGN